MKYGYVTADPLLYSGLKEYARKNRNNPTEAERYIWFYLRGSQLGVKFQRQHIIDRFIADFVCLSHKLVIEIDGGYHQLPEQKESDEERTEILSSLGFTVLRFTNEEVMKKGEKVLNSIKDNLNNATK